MGYVNKLYFYITSNILSDDPEAEYWDRVFEGEESFWLDKLARKIFPIIFTVCNIVYWSVCSTIPVLDVTYPEGLQEMENA